jgi:hypothetical protein
MIGRSHLVGLATVLLVGCTSTAKQASVTPETAPVAAPRQGSVPAVQPLGTVTVPGVPGLVPQTNAKTRASGVVTGRIDPFASVQNGPLVLPIAAVTPAKPRIQPVAVPGKPALVPLGRPPELSQGGLPNLAPAPGNLPTVGLPAMPTAMPPASPTAIADRIAITGVVQMRGKWHVIVQESATGTSRYVSTGDALAGGQVIVKRIIPGAEPLIVLQQNGQEITRTVGSGVGPLARS